MPAATTLPELLSPGRPTHVIDIGANPSGGDQPYRQLLAAGLCELIGFEPEEDALAELRKTQTPNVRYLPYAVGDGQTHTLHVGPWKYGMTSLFEPNPEALRLFRGFEHFGEIVERVPIQTRRLDTITEIGHLDFLKIDVQGGELAVFQGGRSKLAEAVAIQTEVSFVPLYTGQPALGDIDSELRSQGFIPHCFTAIKDWPIADHGDGAGSAYRQLLEADMVYIRDMTQPDSLSDEQLKHLALVAHYCYRSFDLALHCVSLLQDRGTISSGVDGPATYRRILDEHQQELRASAMYDDAAALVDDNRAWPEVQNAYLDAWEFRPSRAEPLHALARQCRMNRRFDLGYLYAQRAAKLPFPQNDVLTARADIYAWRARDELAICAEWLGRHTEAFDLCRDLLARPGIPERERQRIASNRDFSVPALLEEASRYRPEAVPNLVLGSDGVTVTLTCGSTLNSAEQTLNSFLHSCRDVSAIGRFILFDAGLDDENRRLLADHYPFLEITGQHGVQGFDAVLAELRTHIGDGRWLHLGEGWRFFAPENLITRLTGVLDAEPDVFQVGVNYGDAHALTGTIAPADQVCRTGTAGRYVLTGRPARGPAMFDLERLDRAEDFDTATDTGSRPASQIARITATGLRTASLDEVLCVQAPDASC